MPDRITAGMVATSPALARRESRDAALVATDGPSIDDIRRACRERFAGDADIAVAFLVGSRARGTAIPRSDVDLVVIVRDGPGGFASEMVDGLGWEFHRVPLAEVEQRLDARPVLAHDLRAAVPLVGDSAVLARMAEHARGVLRAYRVPERERAGTIHWLRTCADKCDAAAHDPIRCAFIVATSFWELLVGLWQLNAQPIPANTLAYEATPTLPRLPAGFADLYRTSLEAPPTERALAFAMLARRVADALAGDGVG